MTTLEPPLPNLLGFIADEDKEFQASLARDRGRSIQGRLRPDYFIFPSPLHVAQAGRGVNRASSSPVVAMYVT
jgi:hypothetical protein